MIDRWDDERHDEEADRRDSQDRLDRALEKADPVSVLHGLNEVRRRRAINARRILDAVDRA